MHRPTSSCGRKTVVSTQHKNKRVISTVQANRRVISIEHKNKRVISTEHKNKRVISTEQANRHVISNGQSNQSVISTEHREWRDPRISLLTQPPITTTDTRVILSEGWRALCASRSRRICFSSFTPPKTLREATR